MELIFLDTIVQNKKEIFFEHVKSNFHKTYKNTTHLQQYIL